MAQHNLIVIPAKAGIHAPAVIPAQAGIQNPGIPGVAVGRGWIPAFAGMTVWGGGMTVGRYWNDGGAAWG